ncbi:MAG: carbamoyl phosphate synthase small subunit [Bacilli bacterium]|nr:carbamoyl phosphate synthase small subunit [Bacilli bacterium]
MQGCLVLENGQIFAGEILGSLDHAQGEVVFHTGMTGYQEILTDPSYANQIVAMTYPLIGNYGINPIDFEAERPWLTGFITGESCEWPSHYQQEQTVAAYLAQNGIAVLTEVDTRSLVRALRSHGTLRGVIVAGTEEEVARQWAAGNLTVAPWETNQVQRVSTPTIRSASRAGAYHVVVMDFGTKENMIRSLINRGCKVTVVPARTSFDTIHALEPDGILLSNGPGNPENNADILPTIRELAEVYPIFGICLGHQLLGLAFGATTYKMTFGHRGSNHPVKELQTGRVCITSQNHGYALNADSIPAELEVTHINVNDGSVEGLRHLSYPCFSVQYHPEACPGPQDSEYLFDRFMVHMAERKENYLVYAT